MKIFTLTFFLLIRLISAQKIELNMPEVSAWKIEIAEKTNSKNFTPAISFVTYKNGDIYKTIYSKTNSGLNEVWTIYGTVFGLSKNGKRYITTSSESLIGSDFSSEDLPHFNWMNSSNFSAQQEIGGQLVNVYIANNENRKLTEKEESTIKDLIQQENSELIYNSSELASKNREQFTRKDALKQLGYTGQIVGYVSSKTNLPILYKSGNKQVKFQKIESKQLKLPPYIKKMYERLKKRKQKNVE